MAIFKPGGVVAAVSGTIGGQTFALGKQTPFIRNASKVKKGNSVTQLKHRSAMKIANLTWQNMSDLFRESWRHVAGTIPFLNRFGTSRFLTGHQLFCQYVLENYPVETDFNFECDIVGQSSKPVVRIVGLGAAGLWIIITDTIYWQDIRDIKIFVSRPVRNTPKKHYSNWFLLFWGSEPYHQIEIQHPAVPHERLSTCQVGEWVCLRSMRREYPTSGRMLYSAPAFRDSVLI